MIFSFEHEYIGNSRFKADNVAYTMAFVTNGCADLTNRVDEFHAEHPLGWGELDLTSKVVDVLDQRSQKHASTLGGIGSHGVDHAGSEGRVVFASRHCVVCMCVQTGGGSYWWLWFGFSYGFDDRRGSGEVWGGHKARLNKRVDCTTANLLGYPWSSKLVVGSMARYRKIPVPPAVVNESHVLLLW